MFFMDEKKIKHEELLSRREFFKEASKKTLPVVAIIAIPNVLASCDKDLWDSPHSTSGTGGGSGCSDCSAACRSSCSSSCYTTCRGGCTGQLRAPYGY